MDQDQFEKYLKNRYEEQIDWYDKKSLFNQKIYKYLQGTLIILTALTPVLIAFSFHYSKCVYLSFIPIIVSVVVAILTAALKTFKYQENWINYRTICETLKKEIHLYQAKIGDYREGADKEALFVERVESLISRENTLWIETCKEEHKELI